MKIVWFAKKTTRQVTNSLTLISASCPTSRRFGIMNSRNIAAVRKTKKTFAGMFSNTVFRSRLRRRASPNARHYAEHKEKARELVHARLAHWNEFYKYTYKRVAIRNQRSRWGSCSTQQNLNFNYRLVFLPLELVDYVVVHELCHLAHFNHSQNFWNLVAQAIPDYEKRMFELKKTQLALSPIPQHYTETV
jgi:predicted metal-dependent hydrolase